MACKNKLQICVFLLVTVSVDWPKFYVSANQDPVDLNTIRDKNHMNDGSHNKDYDHDAFLGADEAKSFDQLSPEESKNRLGLIVDKIDVTNDGKVTFEELKDWITYIQQKYIRDNVDRTWKTHNPENKDKISWEDYSKIVYGFIKDLGSQAYTQDENGMSYKLLYDRDNRRWHAADLDEDNLLDKEEFLAFLHPEESPRMRHVVVQEALEDIDKDKDGKISLDEYMGDMTRGEETDEKPAWVVTEIENFSKHRDVDGDGFLSGDEIKSWIMPQDFDHAEAEARHLIYEADSNRDNELTKDEFLEKYDIFVGSQATDFGQILTRHDEF